MQAVTQSGISLSRSAIRRSVFLCFFLGVFSLGAVTLAFAEANLTVKLKLPKLPWRLKQQQYLGVCISQERAARFN
jgi:Na+/H+ antiporter NhaA